MKPRAGGGSGLGLKKVEQVPEEDLPDELKPADGGSTFSSGGKKIKLEGPSDEPGGVFATILIASLVILLIGVYILFANYSKMWIPEMDAHADMIPQPPSGLLIK